MKKTLLIVPFVTLLSACGAPSVEDLVDDPKLLQEVAEDCSEMKRSEAKADEACQNLQVAAEKLTKEAMDGVMGQVGKLFK